MMGPCGILLEHECCSGYILFVVPQGTLTLAGKVPRLSFYTLLDRKTCLLLRHHGGCPLLCDGWAITVVLGHPFHLGGMGRMWTLPVIEPHFPLLSTPINDHSLPYTKLCDSGTCCNLCFDEFLIAFDVDVLRLLHQDFDRANHSFE